jgi:hypothetical protein
MMSGVWRAGRGEVVRTGYATTYQPLGPYVLETEVDLSGWPEYFKLGEFRVVWLSRNRSGYRGQAGLLPLHVELMVECLVRCVPRESAVSIIAATGGCERGVMLDIRWERGGARAAPVVTHVWVGKWWLASGISNERRYTYIVGWARTRGRVSKYERVTPWLRLSVSS